MLAEIGARDRLVMGSLVVLGLLTIAAGVFSGRSTMNYVLLRDAYDASAHWSHAIDMQLDRRGTLPSRILDKDVNIVAASKLESGALGGNSGPQVSAAGKDVFALPEGLKEALVAWALKHMQGTSDDFVSRLDGFAVLGPDRQVFALAGDLDQRKFESLLATPAASAAFGEAVEMRKASVVNIAGGSGADRLIFVPKLQNGGVGLVYAFAVDQSAAAAMTGWALTMVTLTTSLLIVMGFSVPAVIASRRIRERLAAEDQIRFLAMHDSLTGLPNRLQLRQHLDRAVARARRHERPVAVLCLDLDRFKDVNDTLGHPTGDALLEEVAARLKENLRESDLVGRQGGDEFAIVAEDLDSPEDAVRVARRICTALAEPYHVNGHEVTVSTSIGIAFGPSEGNAAESLLKDADLALYRAKHDGRNTFRFFEPAMDAALQKRRRLESDLRVALRRSELYLDYQPQFDLKTGKLTGYEALARWWHPVEGDVPPAVFVPIAEETGLIAPLGEWILRTACTYASSWPEDTTLAVNLSPVQFRTQDVEELVRKVLAETGLPARRLELEITESILLQNTQAVLDTLERLDKLGVSIAMDDFGTGYSSLSYLTRFPVRKIKIDRSFIDTLGTSPQTSAIVSSIVGLGQSLKVTITAEGVETAGQAEMLKTWGCDQVQGFFYGRPKAEILEPEKATASTLVA